MTLLLALLYVRRGVWKSTVGETKTATRRKPVPVIARLRSLLAILIDESEAPCQ
jgi:hypothetical protein